MSSHDDDDNDAVAANIGPMKPPSWHEGEEELDYDDDDEVDIGAAVDDGNKNNEDDDDGLFGPVLPPELQIGSGKSGKHGAASNTDYSLVSCQFVSLILLLIVSALLNVFLAIIIEYDRTNIWTDDSTGSSAKFGKH